MKEKPDKVHAQTEIELKFSDFKQPQVFGFADRCWIERREDFLEFRFFEERASSTHLVARFVIGLDDVANELWPRTERFHSELKALAQAANVQATPISTQKPDAGDVAAVICNLVGLTRSGLDAQIDGYYMTPRSIVFSRQLKDKKRLEAIPVLSVQLPTRLMLGVLNHLANIVGPIRTEIEAMKGFA